MVGFHAESYNITDGTLDIVRYERAAESASKLFDIPAVAITLCQSFSADRNGWTALMLSNGEFHTPHGMR